MPMDDLELFFSLLVLIYYLLFQKTKVLELHENILIATCLMVYVVTANIYSQCDSPRRLLSCKSNFFINLFICGKY